ncbi:hypothetical protein AKUG0406_02190 [Apilactobacillus kunkeei]|nr:hypothetical protein AKUG0406_02190 [Apilactobacillus kunkeei]CAI2563230.1 hypothetical protein AKUG0403_02190 [Apilactobacillus kunkeei]CAI2563306.1 hypothetical protein AKUG0420_02160 [Apilactobacillus kunkeei]
MKPTIKTKFTILFVFKMSLVSSLIIVGSIAGHRSILFDIFYSLISLPLLLLIVSRIKNGESLLIISIDMIIFAELACLGTFNFLSFFHPKISIIDYYITSSLSFVILLLLCFSIIISMFYYHHTQTVNPNLNNFRTKYFLPKVILEMLKNSFTVISIIYGGIKIMDDNSSFTNANISLAFIYCIELPLIILTIISWYELVKIGEEITNKKRRQ